MLLIGLLRQRGDLDGARRARNAMSEVFPLSEGGRGGEGREGERGGGRGRRRGCVSEEREYMYRHAGHPPFYYVLG